MKADEQTKVSMRINGKEQKGDVEPRTLLVYFLRDELNLTGTHVGCDTGHCGACTIVMDDKAVKSCMVLAVQAAGAEILTVEGLADDDELHPIQEAFKENHGLQCGFCTPGLLMSSLALLRENPNPTEEDIRRGIEGNLCRCTGYVNVVKSIRAAAEAQERNGGRASKLSALLEQELSVAQEERVSELKGRLEDSRLLTGKGRFVDDLRMVGQAYMGVVRSPYAHARIKRIDFSKLQSSPDFIAALTGEDLLKEGVATVSDLPVPAHKFANRHQLAVGKTRFAGEPVAAILVKRKNSVEDLIEEVEVDYEMLPAVTSIEESKKGDTLVFEDWSDNVYHALSRKRGDAESAIAAAPHVISTREGIARQEAAPMEPRSVLVNYKKEEDLYEVYATVQSVHFLRQYLSSELRIPEAKFHVKVMDMGGGFGSKGGNSYPEPVLACLFSRRTGMPVKWTATRTGGIPRGSSRKGRVLRRHPGVRQETEDRRAQGKLECDVGVSGLRHLSLLAVGFMLGTYEIPNLDLSQCYVTNKMPVGPVRELEARGMLLHRACHGDDGKEDGTGSNRI